MQVCKDMVNQPGHFDPIGLGRVFQRTRDARYEVETFQLWSNH